MNEHDKNAILFSRTVKAGKRIYYIDVKQDRRGEYYLSLTESKRLQSGTEQMPPVIEKHKIFVYREDFEKFQQAFEDALSYVHDKQGDSFSNIDTEADEASIEQGTLADDTFRLHVDFE
ncbi:MAG: DUF3276 family protein [Bacteroidaceae bacterium]|nr:DUF3276 family protein [Bacteroidaceae bacterium]